MIVSYLSQTVHKIRLLVLYRYIGCDCQLSVTNSSQDQAASIIQVHSV